MAAPAQANQYWSSDNNGCYQTSYYDCHFEINYSPGDADSGWFFSVGNVPDYNGRSYNCGEICNVSYIFGGNLNGAGQGVRNNAAKGDNDGSESRSYVVYYSVAYGGHWQQFSPAQVHNFDSTLRNNNASSQEL